GFMHARNIGGLLLGPLREFAGQQARLLRRSTDIPYGGARVLDFAHAGVDASARGVEQLADLVGRPRAALGQRTHFSGNYGETLALVARVSRLTAAFSDNRLVWNARSSITFTTSTMLRV